MSFVCPADIVPLFEASVEADVEAATDCAEGVVPFDLAIALAFELPVELYPHPESDCDTNTDTDGEGEGEGETLGPGTEACREADVGVGGSDTYASFLMLFRMSLRMVRA